MASRLPVDVKSEPRPFWFNAWCVVQVKGTWFHSWPQLHSLHPVQVHSLHPVQVRINTGITLWLLQKWIWWNNLSLSLEAATSPSRVRLRYSQIGWIDSKSLMTLRTLCPRASWNAVLPRRFGDVWICIIQQQKFNKFITAVETGKA